MVEENKYPERAKVRVSELNTPFLVERIGNVYQGKYGPTYPLDITLADGTLAVVWVNGDSVTGRQVKDGEVSTDSVYEIVNATSKAGREYRAFRGVTS